MMGFALIVCIRLDRNLESQGNRRERCNGFRSHASLRRFLILVTVLLLASAASRAQKPDTPNAPTATAYLTHIAPESAPVQAAFPHIMAQSAPPANSISLYTVVDLALRNSKAVLISTAARKHALAFWAETRHIYIPNFSLGSGLGYSYGFPLGSPTVFNANSTSLLFSFSQRDYIRSAKAAAKAATLSLKDTRQRVILDAARTYIDLGTTVQQIAALKQASSDAGNLVGIMRDRLRAGLQSELDVTNAQLTQAKIQLRELQMEDHADELRKHLSDLTGQPMESIVPDSSSVPPLPDIDFAVLMEKSANTPAVQSAQATADSRMFNAWGDKRQNYRPTIGLAFQYARFAPFNGYNQYYQKFNYNNIGIGIQATWPLFDPIRRDKAKESQAEALHARREAELARIQNSETDLTLWHNLVELEAQARVAELQQQVAKETLASTMTQMNRGSAGVSTSPTTPQQAQEGRIEERTSYVDLQDANFNVIKLKLELLNAMGGLENWVKQESAPPAFSKK